QYEKIGRGDLRREIGAHRPLRGAYKRSMKVSTRTILSERLVDKSATSPPSSPATSGETVTVACKIPSGLRIAAHRWEEWDEPGPTVSRRAKRAVEVANFIIAGPNSTLPLGTPSY